MKNAENILFMWNKLCVPEMVHPIISEVLIISFTYDNMCPSLEPIFFHWEFMYWYNFFNASILNYTKESGIENTPIWEAYKAKNS